MNKNIVAGIIAAVIIVGGAAAYMVSQQNEDMQLSDPMDDKKLQGDTMTEEAIRNAANGQQRMDNTNSMRGDVMIEGDALNSNELMQQQVGSYKDYSPATVESEQKLGNKVVLFFHAPWCPYCKAADSAFKTNLDKIPKGVTVLKIDYDSNVDLRQKYGVTYQHTFVQIDSDENLVTKWNSGDIDLLIKNIK